MQVPQVPTVPTIAELRARFGERPRPALFLVVYLGCVLALAALWLTLFRSTIRGGAWWWERALDVLPNGFAAAYLPLLGSGVVWAALVAAARRGPEEPPGLLVVLPAAVLSVTGLLAWEWYQGGALRFDPGDLWATIVGACVAAAYYAWISRLARLREGGPA